MGLNQLSTILFIAGPSGVGKSHLCATLARELNRPVLEVDDLFTAVEALTTPEEQPMIHYWRIHPDPDGMPSQDGLKRHLEVCNAITPAIAAVIDDHLRFDKPVLIEGDYILPELVLRYGDRMSGIFLYEDDRFQIARNFQRREPEGGEQLMRGEVSYLFGEWLKHECEEHELLALPARPWASLHRRAMNLLG